jgi:predicted regulator of Ras-like GTPase activity (Roadblock/LC7/MglB family)
MSAGQWAVLIVSNIAAFNLGVLVMALVQAAKDIDAEWEVKR